MNWQLVPFALLSVLIGGCTAANSSSSTGPNHPASPAAMETPRAGRSTTLASAVLTDATAQPAAHDHTQSSAGDSAAHQHAAAPATAPALYTCPMHPEVISTKADDRCPKCGMKLKLKPATQPTAALAATASEPAGHNHGAPAATTQPSAVVAAAAGHASHAGAMHACAMHPEVVSADADAKCSKCDMKVKPVPATQSASPAPAAGHDHGGH